MSMSSGVSYVSMLFGVVCDCVLVFHLVSFVSVSMSFGVICVRICVYTIWCHLCPCMCVCVYVIWCLLFLCHLVLSVYVSVSISFGVCVCAY